MAESAPESSSPNSSSPRNAAGELDDLLTRVSDLTGDIAQQVGAETQPTVAPPQVPAISAAVLDEAIASEMGHAEPGRPYAGPETMIEHVPAPPPAAAAAKGKVIQLGKGKGQPGGNPSTGPRSPGAKSEPMASKRQAEAQARGSPSSAQDAVAASREGWAIRCAGAILDACDRPFRWCGPVVRSIAGWAALAIFFAAILVLGMSFLS